MVVVVKLTSIMLNDLDFVFTVALVRASMEEASVLITLDRSPDLASLFLHQRLSMSDSAKDADNDSP